MPNRAWSTRPCRFTMSSTRPFRRLIPSMSGAWRCSMSSTTAWRRHRRSTRPSSGSRRSSRNTRSRRAERYLMNSASAIDIGRSGVGRETLWRFWRGELKGSEYTWAIAFILPYIAVFLVFVAYPVFYGLWMGSAASLYRELFSDPIYQSTIVNTALYLALAVNVKMVLALLLSGFFMRQSWWMQALLLIYILPWAVPVQSAFISVHWMLNGEWGFLNNLLDTMFHIDY